MLPGGEERLLDDVCISCWLAYELGSAKLAISMGWMKSEVEVLLAAGS